MRRLIDALSITERYGGFNAVFAEVVEIAVPVELISREQQTLAALTLGEANADHELIVEELIGNGKKV